MLLDDLDFLLLDAAAEHKLQIQWLYSTNAESALCQHIPPHTFEELTRAFVELFERGDALASIRKAPRWRGAPWKHSAPIVPTRDEIEAGLRGAFDLDYELTPQGGARWEAVVQGDWSLYRSTEESDRFRWSEAQSRECLEYGIEVDRAHERIKGAIQWKELRPWQPVYWKEFPVGFRVRCGLGKRASSLSGPPGDVPASPWGLECTPRFSHGPASLVPRKERIPAPKPAGEMASWPIEKLESELKSSLWEQRRQFAVACAYAPIADAEALLSLFQYSYTESRFAAIRELARRREKAAVRQLTALVLQESYAPALWALGEIGDERTLPVLEMLLEYGVGGGTLVRALAQFGERALPMLERALASKEHPTWSDAVVALGLIGTEVSRALLERELERAGVRRWECSEIKKALGRRPDWQTPEYLAASRLRRVACVVSGERCAPPPDDPIQALVDTLSHSESARRRAAVDLLVECEASDRLPDISRLAKDPEWEVRASVAHALLRLGGDRRLLGALAKDPNPAVRWLAKHPIIPAAG